MLKKYTITELENTQGLEQVLELQQQNLPLLPKLELDRKKIGPKAKQHMNALLKKFSETNPQEIIKSINQNENYKFEINGSSIVLDKEDFLVDFDAKEGYAVAKRDEYVVFISTTRNQEMMAKGLIKDLARRLQTLRKERGYNPTDVLNKASILGLEDESLKMIKGKEKRACFSCSSKRC